MRYSWRSKRRQIGQPFEEQKLQQAELSRLKRENTCLEEEVTGSSVLCENAQVKYAMIKGNEDHFPVDMMCRLLSVSRSGYYSWKNRPLSGRDQANQELLTEIKRVFEDEKKRSGSPRISRRPSIRRQVGQSAPCSQTDEGQRFACESG